MRGHYWLGRILAEAVFAAVVLAMAAFCYVVALVLGLVPA